MLGSIHRCIGILYFLALLLLFKDMTITWCNKHAEVSKVSFYSSLQPLCMTIFFKFFKHSQEITIVHLVSSGFALIGYIIVFSEKKSEAERLKAQRKTSFYYQEDLEGCKSLGRLYNRINVKHDFFYSLNPTEHIEDGGSLLMIMEGEKEFDEERSTDRATTRIKQSLSPSLFRRFSFNSSKLNQKVNRDTLVDSNSSDSN